MTLNESVMRNPDNRILCSTLSALRKNEIGPRLAFFCSGSFSLLVSEPLPMSGVVSSALMAVRGSSPGRGRGGIGGKVGGERKNGERNSLALNRDAE